MSEPSSNWPCPTTFEQLRAQLQMAAHEEASYEIDAAKLLKLLDEGQQESTEAHARLAALLGVDAKDVGLGELVDMVRPQVVADKDWYKKNYQVEVASEPSSPAPVYEVPGWRLGAPAAGFKSFRCADPECEGNDHTVQLFHMICYRCLHKPSYSHKYQEKDGYQVKVWPPQPPQKWAVLTDSSRVAIAGKVDEEGRWYGAGLPVGHMDFYKAVEFAVFEAEKQEKAVRNA